MDLRSIYLLNKDSNYTVFFSDLFNIIQDLLSICESNNISPNLRSIELLQQNPKELALIKDLHNIIFDIMYVSNNITGTTIVSSKLLQVNSNNVVFQFIIANLVQDLIVLNSIPALNPLAIAYFDRLSALGYSEPSEFMKIVYSDLVTNLQTGLINGTNVWAKADRFWWRASEIKEHNLVSIINPLSALVEENNGIGITWGKYQGYHPTTGSSHYLNLKFNGNVDGVNFVLNSSSIFFNSQTNADGFYVDFGATNSAFTQLIQLDTKDSNVFYTALNDAAAGSVISSTSIGFKGVSRTSDSNLNIHQDSSYVNLSVSSVGIPNFELFESCRNNYTTPLVFSPRNNIFTFLGAGLTVQEAADLKAATDLAYSTLTTAIAGTMNVVWIAGQSNVTDRGNIASLTAPSTDVKTNAWSFYRNVDGVIENGAIQPFHAGYNSFYAQAGAATNFGISATLANKLSDTYSKKTLIVNSSVGGTHLDPSVATPCWLPDTSSSLYNRSIDYFVLPALAKTYYTTKNLIIVWGQGETDSIYATSSTNYYDNMVTLINKSRLSVGSGGTGYTNVIWIIIKLMDLSLGTYPYRATIQTAQIDLAANLSDVYLYDTSGETLSGDGVHKTDGSYIMEGNGLADLINSILL